MTFLSILRVTDANDDLGPNRVSKYVEFDSEIAAQNHVNTLEDVFPEAFVVAMPEDSGFSDWLFDPIAKTVEVSPHSVNKHQSDNDLIKERFEHDPLIRKLLSRQAKIENKTLEEVQDEILIES